MDISAITQSLNSQAAVGMLVIKSMNQAKQLIDQQTERLMDQVKKDAVSINAVEEAAGSSGSEEDQSRGGIGQSLNIIA
ncbi:MAG: hypothetical protein ACP5I1_21315 [Candidatus Hinthialibacter sp.]